MEVRVATYYNSSTWCFFCFLVRSQHNLAADRPPITITITITITFNTITIIMVRLLYFLLLVSALPSTMISRCQCKNSKKVVASS